MAPCLYGYTVLTMESRSSARRASVTPPSTACRSQTARPLPTRYGYGIANLNPYPNPNQTLTKPRPPMPDTEPSRAPRLSTTGGMARCSAPALTLNPTLTLTLALILPQP